MAGGPLEGLKVVEFEGLGPGPFACMMLCNHGAEVTRIRRPGSGARVSRTDLIVGQNRNNVELDLKDPAAIAKCIEIIAASDALIEGFRPGVMERLGLGPGDLAAHNPRLVYGRMTGWGQSGPLANTAGHDINYIAISGALGAIGSAERPYPPLNLVADFGGGALYLAFGVLAAVMRARETGVGAVVDCAMVDGVASLMSMMWGMRSAGMWGDTRRANLLDGGCPFYDTYSCADGQWVAVGALEPQFYAILLEKLQLTELADVAQYDEKMWPRIREAIAGGFARHTRAEICALFEGSDGCVSPILTMGEALDHPHMKARGIFGEGSMPVPAPAPRFAPLKPATGKTGAKES